MGWEWGKSLVSGWGPFEFIDMCVAAGIEPVVTTSAQDGTLRRSVVVSGFPAPNLFVNLKSILWNLKLANHVDISEPVLVPGACCEPDDMADLIEYCHGNASTVWGAQRIADGHADPYVQSSVTDAVSFRGNGFICRVYLASWDCC